MFGSSLSCLTVLVFPRARLYDSTCLQFSVVYKFYHAHCSYDVTLIFASYIKTVGSELELQYYVGFNFIPPSFFQICNRLSMLSSFAKMLFPFVNLICAVSL